MGLRLLWKSSIRCNDTSVAYRISENVNLLQPKNLSNKQIDRRDFLRGLAGLGLGSFFPWFPTNTSSGAVSPCNRLALGCIGTGDQGIKDLKALLHQTDTEIVAVCDVDRSHREKAKSIVENHYAKTRSTGSYKGCACYNDFRSVLAREDIDAVLVATPDHWHAIPVIEAAKAGKDIYCEKPLALTIGEGRAMCNAVRQYGAVFQVGTHSRSFSIVRRACELVRNGRIGKVHTVRLVCAGGPSNGPQPTMPVPPGFDYDMWLGPAPWAPYTELRCHGMYRWNMDKERFIDDPEGCSQDTTFQFSCLSR